MGGVATSAREFALQQRVFRALSAILVAAAWASLGYGLIYSPSNQEAWDQLDAGGRFALNFDVYLPFFALTVPVVIVVVLGLLRVPTALSPLALTVVVVVLFAWWVTTQDFLLTAKPHLLLFVGACALTASCAAGALAGAWAARKDGGAARAP